MIRLFVFTITLVASFASFAQDGSDGMCLVHQAELAALVKAEKVQSRGLFAEASLQLRRIASSAPSHIASRAVFRIAEIEEDLMWSNSNHLQDLRGFLKRVQGVRNAFLEVTKWNESFWSRRAAYRIMLLIDDVLSHLPKFAHSQRDPIALSPFDVLFSHHLSHAALNRVVAELEQERRVLEQTLLADLTNPSADSQLYNAISSRAHEGSSPYLGDFISPPWDDKVPEGTIIRKAKSYYRVDTDEQLTPLARVHALVAMRDALKRFENPIPFAFALAQLSDEQQVIPENLLVAGLQSPDAIVRLAALYASQKSPSHTTTSWLLALLPKKNTSVLFATPQQILFRENERVLLALASHFALGRHSKAQILASNHLRSEDKAWLENYVKTRNEAAAGAWHS